MSEVGQKVMRAKLQVQSVERSVNCERLKMCAVAKDGGYPEDGSDEDNTFAKWSPQAEFTLVCANPALFGQINPGERFYVDFTRAPDYAPPSKN